MPRPWLPVAAVGFVAASSGACGHAAPAPAWAPPSNQAEPGPEPPTARCEPSDDVVCLPTLALRLHDGAWLPPTALHGKVVVAVPAWFDAAPAIAAAAASLAWVDPLGHRTIGLAVPRDSTVAAALMRNDQRNRLSVVDPLAAPRFGLGFETVLAIYDRTGTLRHRWVRGVDRGELDAALQALLTAP